MSIEELRIACLKLAVEAQAGDPVKEAKRMANFVLRKANTGGGKNK